MLCNTWTNPSCNTFWFYCCAKRCARICGSKVQYWQCWQYKKSLHSIAYIAQFWKQYSNFERLVLRMRVDWMPVKDPANLPGPAVSNARLSSISVFIGLKWQRNHVLSWANPGRSLSNFCSRQVILGNDDQTSVKNTNCTSMLKWRVCWAARGTAHWSLLQLSIFRLSATDQKGFQNTGR